MWKVFVAVGAISIVGLSQSAGIIQVAPTDDDEKYIEIITDEKEPTTSEKPVWSKQASLFRRVYEDASQLPKRENRRSNGEEADREVSLKQKISVLVDTAMKDINYKMKYVNTMKEKYKDDNEYKIGFILVMVKKSREVLNELFNVAVKHREQWKILEELRIFELIVHTNVDTTHLVRQLLELHMEVQNKTVHPFVRMKAYEPPEGFRNWGEQPMMLPMVSGEPGPPQPEIPGPPPDPAPSHP